MKRLPRIAPLVVVAVFFAMVIVHSFAGPFSVSAMGDFRIGKSGPDKPGDELFHPYGLVPPSKFYIYVRQPGIPYAQCVYEECGRGGEMVATLRGWLWGSGLDGDSDSKIWLADHQLPSSLTSLVIVADANASIVGIYPNADMSDVEKILKKHPDLADFGMLKGIRQIGEVMVGGPLPFKPTHMFEDSKNVPQQTPKFYVYVVHETGAGSYCPYYECGAYIDAVYQAGGAFDAFDHDNPDIIKKLGLSPSQVARGEITAVIVADADGIITSIHPNKDMRDIFTILNQHPDLADTTKMYRR